MITKTDLCIEIMRNVGLTNNHVLSIPYSKDYTIVRINNYPNYGVMVELYDKRGHFVCEKKVNESFKKCVLESIYRNVVL